MSSHTRSALERDFSSSGGNQSLAGEARTQAYLREQARSNRIAPNVPTVYGTFNDGACNTYLVMEHIDALSFRAWVDAPCISDEEHEHRTTTAVTAIAKALSWLLTCPIPEGDTIGPVGGGCIQHSFFDMEEAPVPLVSAAALEKYVNKALTRRPGRPQDTVSFADEACIFSHSDVSLDNFLWDPATQRVWLTDCQHINVLPESFCSFYLHTSTDPIVQAVSAALNFPTSSQLGLLKSANGIVIQSGTSSFGLDAYGNPSLGRK
ncbi:hypothetical protein DXG03_005876 [Asterophora parasitica]|uniref:Aminoglycoside phosphotransferase domain-containing protein n=1 Tax=Asterophora parasitica TaxID=117018 RepID=A0A9P7K9Q1_9AGAR|nr:hypothetical protein DXG03_005876 [Asterophora parasitica]